jgi:hypothetical protein
MFDKSPILKWEQISSSEIAANFFFPTNVKEERFTIRYRKVVDNTNEWTMTLYQLMKKNDQQEKPNFQRTPASYPFRVLAASRRSVVEFVEKFNPPVVHVGMIPDIKLQRIYQKAIPKYLQTDLQPYGYVMRTTELNCFTFAKGIL